jgi:hypothetical protein
MKTYRMNAVMAGFLYFLGTVFGVLSGGKQGSYEGSCPEYYTSPNC